MLIILNPTMTNTVMMRGAVLCTLSEAIRRFFAEDEVCCRIDGEECSILLPDMTTAQAIERAEDFLLEVASRDLRYREGILPLETVSAGVAAYPENASSLEELTRVADAVHV